MPENKIIQAAAEALAQLDGEDSADVLLEGGVAEEFLSAVEPLIRAQVADEIRALAPHTSSLWHDAYWHAAEVASGGDPQ